MVKQSKFDYDCFRGDGIDNFAVSKQRYTKEEAIEIAKREITWWDPKFLAIGDGYVIHRAGITDDGECCVGWWLEYEPRKRSCPAWVFHAVESMDNECYPEEYDYIKMVSK